MESVANAQVNAGSVGVIVWRLARHPYQHVVRRWNWKSAVLSAIVRSSLFFMANLSAGADAARAAFLTEVLFRCSTAGFYGAVTHAFRDAQPPMAGTLAAMLILPVTTHLLEFIVHRLRGTVRLAASIELSIAFTAISTAFNLFVMRRGALVVGAGSESIWSDLRRMPLLAAAFVVVLFRGPWRLVRRLLH
jgi:hypothetical protein